MNNWQALREAEIKAQAEEERLCALYDCYPWEINIERMKPKNRRKEVLPFIYKHMDNGVEVSNEALREVFIKHKAVEEDAEGELNVELETLDPDLLEDILSLFIKANDQIKKSQAQNTQSREVGISEGLPSPQPLSKIPPLETGPDTESTTSCTSLL